MLTDTHCHLDPESFDGDEGVDAAIARARHAGVTRMITVGAGYGVACAPRAVAVAERHADVWCSVGVHPHDATDWSDETEALLRRLAAHPRCVAWGELGLDFYYENSPRDAQRTALRAQLGIARELDLPVIVHDRDSEGETLDILAEEGAFEGAGVVWHCYTGDVPYMEKIVAAGGYISIPGIVTFKKAGYVAESAAACPIDRLLIETDSPFLAPVPYRGKRNEPAYVARVADQIATLRGLSVDEVARITSANATRFFRLPEA